jgi:hypothetical protein
MKRILDHKIKIIYGILVALLIPLTVFICFKIFKRDDPNRSEGGDPSVDVDPKVKRFIDIWKSFEPKISPSTTESEWEDMFFALDFVDGKKLETFLNNSDISSKSAKLIKLFFNARKIHKITGGKMRLAYEFSTVPLGKRSDVVISTLVEMHNIGLGPLFGLNLPKFYFDLPISQGMANVERFLKEFPNDLNSQTPVADWFPVETSIRYFPFSQKYLESALNDSDTFPFTEAKKNSIRVVYDTVGKVDKLWEAIQSVKDSCTSSFEAVSQSDLETMKIFYQTDFHKIIGLNVFGEVDFDLQRLQDPMFVEQRYRANYDENLDSKKKMVSCFEKEFKDLARNKPYSAENLAKLKGFWETLKKYENFLDYPFKGSSTIESVLFTLGESCFGNKSVMKDGVSLSEAELQLDNVVSYLDHLDKSVVESILPTDHQIYLNYAELFMGEIYPFLVPRRNSEGDPNQFISDSKRDYILLFWTKLQHVRPPLQKYSLTDFIWYHYAKVQQSIKAHKKEISDYLRIKLIGTTSLLKILDSSEATNVFKTSNPTQLWEKILESGELVTVDPLIALNSEFEQLTKLWKG